MKKINKKLSLCIALALMQSAFVSNSFAAAPTVTNQGSGYYFGIGTEPTLADLAKKELLIIRKPIKSLKIIMRTVKVQALMP